MDTRKIKIEDHGDPYIGKQKSKIRLIGAWLNEAGFPAGAHVKVEVQKERIVIEVDHEYHRR